MHENPTRRRRIRAAALAGGLALGLSFLGAQAAVAAPAPVPVDLDVTPAVTVGAPVDVTIGLAGTADVFAYQIELDFDPALLAYQADTETGPAGGYLSAVTGDGKVTLLQTRLGTSPALSGDLAASVKLTTLAAGDATVTAHVTLVDGSGAGTVIPATPAAAIDIAAAPTVPPTTPPTTSPTATPSPTPSDAPTATATPAAVASSDSGSLALTGFGVGGLIVFAVAALAVGLVVVLRRRAASAR
ncbi:cohesin domain-containing protein [Herbiconiux solani]|uniref:cohesin domain-containing protein n=1 Tax=Herbiconiux solani TaxID=661329 RepID=UPI000826BBA7|nr:cohesin domain-containing protein [Herbiconiux solani]